MTKKLLKFIFLNKKNILNYMEGYYCKFISFLFSFLLLSNIGMETNNHSNLVFLSSSKC